MKCRAYPGAPYTHIRERIPRIIGGALYIEQNIPRPSPNRFLLKTFQLQNNRRDYFIWLERRGTTRPLAKTPYIILAKLYFTTFASQPDELKGQPTGFEFIFRFCEWVLYPQLNKNALN